MKISIALIMVLTLASCSKTINSQPLTDLQELSSNKYEGRKAGTAGGKNAAAYIIGRFEEIGLTPLKNTWKQEFLLKNEKNSSKHGANTIGYIAGKRAQKIVISAHYDHLGIIDGKIYNGADDNASGVAGLLSLATYFQKNKPEYTLVFACFDAEESGLQGSRFFIENPPFDLNEVILNINMDMISRADKGEIYACGTYHYPQFKKYLVSNHPTIKLKTGHDDPSSGKDDWTNQSDHYVFHLKHIPFIYFGVEDHKDYHQATDDFKKVNKATFTAIVELITSIVAELDKKMSLQSSFRDKLIMKD